MFSSSFWPMGSPWKHVPGSQRRVMSSGVQSPLTSTSSSPWTLRGGLSPRTEPAARGRGCGLRGLEGLASEMDGTGRCGKDVLVAQCPSPSVSGELTQTREGCLGTDAETPRNRGDNRYVTCPRARARTWPVGPAGCGAAQGTRAPRGCAACGRRGQSCSAWGWGCRPWAQTERCGTSPHGQQDSLWSARCWGAGGERGGRPAGAPASSGCLNPVAALHPTCRGLSLREESWEQNPIGWRSQEARSMEGQRDARPHLCWALRWAHASRQGRGVLGAEGPGRS